MTNGNAFTINHWECVPGQSMCPECSKIWTGTSVRHLLRFIRAKHPQIIKDGTCLWCGDVYHNGECDGRDFWGAVCRCAEFVPRERYARK